MPEFLSSICQFFRQPHLRCDALWIRPGWIAHPVEGVTIFVAVVHLETRAITQSEISQCRIWHRILEPFREQATALLGGNG